MTYKQHHTIIFLVLYMFNVISGTHFRGSMISWRIVDESAVPPVVEILQRYAWRYTYFSLCTSATIPNGLPMLGGSDTLDCVSNCPPGITTLGSIAVPCTGYNIPEQYAMGEGRFTITVPQNSSFIATFASAAWFDLVTGTGLGWSVAVQIQTFKRTDTGRYNKAPIVTMLPIYRLRNLKSYSIKINVADNDFDPYICLWSDGPLQCGGLVNSVPGGVVDNYGCYLNFTPTIAGFYAAALTVEDFVILPTDISSVDYLSQVPIQFVFHVYDSPDPCYIGPVYVGDLEPDICIYLPIGVTVTTRVRFKVQCPGATVDSIISVNPTGLLTTDVQQDPLNPTIFAFIANFTSSAQQIGQNLFCFAGVDSIGNQGESACLRFTVASQTSSLHPLYLRNATRYPMGTVTKTTSIWTIMTAPKTYVRPTVEAYIRFRRVSDDADYYVLNAVTELDSVVYYSDRIVINSTVVWTPGEYFYIYFEAGVLVEAKTCSKDSMPISDPKFWPFDIPYETTTTSTSTTSTSSLSSTTTSRTIPTRRTLRTTTTTSSTSSTTTTTVTTTTTSSSSTPPKPKSQLPISAIVGIILLCLFISGLLTWIISSYIQVLLIRFLLLQSGLRRQFLSIHSIQRSDIFYDTAKNTNSTATFHYKLATRFRPRISKHKYTIFNNSDTSVQESLVEVNI